MDANAAKGSEPTMMGRCCHPACLVCGERNQVGLGLRFDEQPDGSVVGRFDCGAAYQGYPDRLHGGVVSMLLDAAMTNCLFARGVQGVTAKLNLRFRHPVRLGVDAVIRAWLVDQYPPLYSLKAELHQEDQTCAVAEAKFFGKGPVSLGEDQA